MTIYKGSNQQVTVAYLPCCYDVEQVSNVKLNFYTTTGSSVEFSGETLNLSGYTATVVFQPAQLELLDDGTLRFIAEFDYSGSPVVKDSCTIYYLKTPAAYEPMHPITEENFSASTALTSFIESEVNEAISGSTAITEVVEEKITEALVDYVDDAELSDAMDAETARTEETYLKAGALDDYYTSGQTDEKIAEAVSGIDLSNYYTSAQTDSAITEAVSGKQDTLTPGEGISISGDTISCTVSGGKPTYNLDTMSQAERVAMFEALSAETTININLYNDFYTNVDRGDVPTRLKVEVYEMDSSKIKFSGVIHNMYNAQKLFIVTTEVNSDGSISNNLVPFGFSWSQIQTGGTKIATVTINDNPTDIYAGNVSSTYVSNIWVGTTAQYAQISTKDPNTLYFINDN